MIIKMKKINFNDIEKLPIDFEDIVSALIARIKDKLPNRWSDFLASNFGMEIIDAIAYEAMLLSYQLNATVNEVYLPTAKTQTSVYRLAKTIGYKPSGPSQASVGLRFYINKTNVNNIYIPKYTRVEGNGITFYTTENVTIVPGSTYIDVNAKSGTISTASFISTGVARYKYVLPERPVNNIEHVIVNDGISGIEYEYIDFIDIKDDAGHYYTTEFDENYNCSISFGDGVYGANPKKGVVFEVTYITNAGENDNVNPYVISSILDNIYDSANNMIAISVTNAQGAVGGSAAESINEIKTNAPAIYRTQQRCVTLTDFEDIVKTYNGVKKVSVIDNSKLDEVGIFGVKVCVIPDGSLYLNNTFKSDLLNMLNEKKIIATQVDVIDPTYIDFDVTVNLKINSYSQSSTVISNARKALYEYLYWENRDFGGEISKNEIYSLLSEIPGVMSISNIDIEESSKISIIEKPIIGTNIIKIADSTGSLNTGCNISILNSSGEYIKKVKIGSYDINTSIITLLNTVNNEDYLISDTDNIDAGCIIYPNILVDGNYTYGNKEINVKAYTIKTELTNSGEYSNSRKIYNMLNMSYMTIYFGEDSTNKYRIMYVNGDTIYLNRALDIDISDNTEITIVDRKYVPALASSLASNSTQLMLDTYPRFNVGSKLIRQESITYSDAVATMIRNNGPIDYMSSAINVSNLVSVEKIYINENKVFIRGVDYELADNDRIITWTNIGLSRITANTTYYVQYVKKTIYSSDSDLTHYVKSIDGKNIEIAPAIPIALPNGTTFDYDSDTIKLLPYEIANQGVITINII